MSEIAEKMNTFTYFDDDNDDNSEESYYELNYMSFYNLFNSPDYNGRITVVNNFNEAINLNNDHGNKFILVVGTEKPIFNDVRVINKGYELRVICYLKSNQRGNSPSSFDSVRFMRHGNKYKSWWKEERNDPITTQCHSENEITKYFSILDENDLYYHQIIQLFVKLDNDTEDYWRTKFI